MAIKYKQHEHNLKDIEQQQFVGYWLKSKGLSLKILEKHKQIDDVILLINIKGAYYKLYNNSENGYWAALWDRCFFKKKPLRQKDLDKLHTNTEQAYLRHLSKQAKIQALRANMNSQKTCQQMI